MINESAIDLRELKLRLQNCLQTILEVRSCLTSMPFGEFFMSELNLLEQFLADLETIQVGKDEVGRIERATSNLLDELKPLVRHGQNIKPGNTGILQ